MFVLTPTRYVNTWTDVAGLWHSGICLDCSWFGADCSDYDDAWAELLDHTEDRHEAGGRSGARTDG